LRDGCLTCGQIRAQLTSTKKGSHKRHHAMPFDVVCGAAQSRIEQLRHDETFEALFRFRLATKKRLWGYVAENVFYVPWWDARHKVYPTDPD
jgi:hypothetical protein